MKYPIKDPVEYEQRNNKLTIFSKDHDSLMKQAMVMLRLLAKTETEFEEAVHSQIIAFDDNNEHDMPRILHQAKMLKNFIQV